MGVTFFQPNKLEATKFKMTLAEITAQNRGGARARAYPRRQATTKGQARQEGPKGLKVQEGQEEGCQEVPMPERARNLRRPRRPRNLRRPRRLRSPRSPAEAAERPSRRHERPERAA